MSGKIGNIQKVVFDFDYTLADSSRGVIGCVNFALEGLGLPAADGERIKRTIGLPLEETFRRLTGREDPDQEREFVRLYVQRADEIVAGLTVLLPQIPETLRTLKQAGLTLGIISNKFRRRIEVILDREGLRDCFGAIVGSEDVEHCKPDPESLLLVVRKLGSTPAGTLYVGDSVTDAETAKRAGVPFRGRADRGDAAGRVQGLSRSSDHPELVRASEPDHRLAAKPAPF